VKLAKGSGHKTRAQETGRRRILAEPIENDFFQRGGQETYRMSAVFWSHAPNKPVGSQMRAGTRTPPVTKRNSGSVEVTVAR